MTYKHFFVEEREKIQEMLWEKQSIRTIALELERSPSSVSREIARNKPALRNQYTPRVAHEHALKKRKCRGRTLRLKSGFIRRYVADKLKEGYSPEQIAGRLSLEHPKESLSHEAIYQYIYSQVYREGHGRMKPGYRDLRVYLKRRHRRRIPKGARKSKRICKPPLVSIDNRPLIVDTRLRIGDWESDSVASRGNGPGINTLVDRKSGLVLISKLSEKTSVCTTNAIIKRLMGYPRHTITFDNGSENWDYEDIKKALSIDPYFAHPYSSFERGTNENTNGLIRWYFPKGTDFATISDEAIHAVEKTLNNRPRKRLGWKTPLEVFNGSVALQH